MGFHTLFIYFIASIILFILLNYINNKKEEIIHYTITTCIYILLLSGICTSLHLTQNNDAIFIVFLFELLIRICYNNMVEENNFFQEPKNVKKYLITFVATFCMNTFFISKVNNVFLTEEQLKIIIWLLIITYLINNTKKDISSPNNKKILYRKKYDKNILKKQYIVTQYARLKIKYSYYIKTRYKELIPLIYAIMIYENRNRPELFRKLDYYLYKLDGKGRKFGIMGIYSKYYIDDENSIAIAIRRIEKIYYQTKNKKDKERIILNNYYKKNNIVNEILEITKEIKKFNQK